MFQASDQNFMLYRSFRLSHCRVLSGLQHEVEQLEKELHRLDAEDNTEPHVLRLCSKVQDEEDSPVAPARSRPLVLSKLKAKLLEYGRFT